MVQMRVACSGAWSRYLHAGEHGEVPTHEPLTEDESFGVVKVDEFVGFGQPLDRLQFRVIFFSVPGDATARVGRLAVACDTATESPWTGWDTLSVRRLAVPFRSQYDGTGELGPRLCSPTCVAMVLAYHTIEMDTLDVARACYDPRHDIYGNWPLAVQAAYDFGLPGYVRRFGEWADVVEFLKRGTPIIASIRFKRGDLPGAPIPGTRGHLVVVTGLTETGDVCVNDPVRRVPGSTGHTYPGEPFARAWFGGSGVGYVLGE